MASTSGKIQIFSSDPRQFFVYDFLILVFGHDSLVSLLLESQEQVRLAYNNLETFYARTLNIL